MILTIAIVAVLARGEGAVDCADRFTLGAYGVPADDPTVRSGALAVKGFAPIYLDKQSVQAADPKTCRYVTTYDVFRLVYEGRAGLPLAGCYSDFDGDGRRDYALLLANPAGEKVLPHIFLAREGGYRVFALNPVTDPYGFNEERFLWPGPFCLKKPDYSRPLTKRPRLPEMLFRWVGSGTSGGPTSKDLTLSKSSTKSLCTQAMQPTPTPSG